MAKKYRIITVVLVLGIIFMTNNSVIKTPESEAINLQMKIEKLMKKISKYDDEEYDLIERYTALNEKYEELDKLFNEYELKYPESLDDDIQKAKKEVDKYYAQVMGFKYKDEDEKEDIWDNEVASYGTSTSTNSSLDYDSPSGSSSSNEESTSESNSHSNVSSNKHIGESVYIANGNSFYHSGVGCKSLRGTSMKVIDINNVGVNHACNHVKY